MAKKETKNKEFTTQIQSIWSLFSTCVRLFCRAYVFKKGCLFQGGPFFYVKNKKYHKGFSMSATRLEAQEFGTIRSFLWPVYRHELKKFVPMILIFFLLYFNYNILRTMKDALVITAKSSGAEVIPFIKVWVMFPSAVLMTFIFTRLTNRYLHGKSFLHHGFPFFSLLFYFLPSSCTL